MAAKTTTTRKATTTRRAGISNTPAPAVAPEIPANLAGVVTAPAAPAAAPAKRTRKTAAEIKATMDAKTAANAAKKAAAAPKTATPRKTAAAAPQATAAAPKGSGEKVLKAVEFLTKNAGTGYAVRDIEANCGYGDKTLAGALARLAATQGTGIQRVGVVRGTRTYKGFRYVAPKNTK